jgi:hypothetical protein
LNSKVRLPMRPSMKADELWVRHPASAIERQTSAGALTNAPLATARGRLLLVNFTLRAGP